MGFQVLAQWGGVGGIVSLMLSMALVAWSGGWWSKEGDLTEVRPMADVTCTSSSTCTTDHMFNMYNTSPVQRVTWLTYKHVQIL